MNNLDGDSKAKKEKSGGLRTSQIICPNSREFRQII
jgi:hypothetical protein